MGAVSPVKVCRGCKSTLSLSEFYAHKMMSDGHLNFCKPCVRQRVRDRERRLRETDREWLEKERARARAKARSQKPRKRRKRSANWNTTNAVRDGRLTPATCCETCGHDFSVYRREAHHHDYEKPLDVRWLCSLCHGKEHRRF